MILKKYDQSCLLIETKGKRILVDPGNIGYKDETLEKEWVDIDAIFITHKHNDHCIDVAINAISNRDEARVYTTKEVMDAHRLDNVIVIKEKDIITLNDSNINIEVVHARHGYLTIMKGNEVRENVGYIIDDGDIKLYITSDTIAFNNDYKCDVICLPFNGNDLTMGIENGVRYAKDTGAKLVVPVHMQHPRPEFNPNISELKMELEKQELNYSILEMGESIEI